MNSNEEKYIAKVNLPGGCTKGMVITVTKTKITYPDGKLCPYDVPNETAFFELVEPPVFALGSKVVVTSSMRVEKCDNEGRTTGASVTLSPFQDMTVVGEVKDGRNRKFAIVRYTLEQVKVPVKDLISSEIYYFIDSKGKLQTAKLGKEPDADVYRKAIGNYAIVKEDAYKYVEKLMALGKTAKQSKKVSVTGK